MKAKKHLGQHFLKSEKAISQIVAAGAVAADDLVLEIGPGHGVLTKKLLAQAKKVVAIEKDRELIPLLQETFDDAIETKRLDIIEADILAFNPETLRSYGQPYKLIANIPYYITGAIIEQFLSASFQPTQMVLLVQKEVAERIVAKDGKESVLSIAVKAYGTPRLVAKVPAGAFAPAPKVDSAIISIEGISRAFFDTIDEALFFKVLKGVFGKKRKQIAGSLADMLGDRAYALSVLKESGIAPVERPENLSLFHWKTLVHTLVKG